MSETEQALPASDTAARQRRIELARKAFREFYAQCFWSYFGPAEARLPLSTMSRSDPLNPIRGHFLSLCPPSRLALVVSAAGGFRVSPVPYVFFFACHAL